MGQFKQNQKLSTFYLFLTAFIWGLSFVAQRVGADYMGVFLFNGVRFALGAFSLIPVILILERKRGASRVTLLAGLAGGAVLYIASTLQQFGVEITGSAGRAGFITGLYTVLVPLLGMLWGRKTSGRAWAGAAAAVVGLYLLSAPDGIQSVSIGDAVLLSGAFFWAAHIILVDHFTDRILPLRFSLTQFVVCAALSLISALFFEDIQLSVLIAGRVPLLYSGILSVGLAYTLQIFGQRGTPPAKAAVIFSLEALFSAVGAAVLLGETMEPRGYLGCAFIFLGILLCH
ncbi:MAG: DMT family transporter [Clostridiales bacterium]|jgi:drug/metabolite transporter (DMT)-like permease|nr:DMT family transporter [Clostridiales bacterium]